MKQFFLQWQRVCALCLILLFSCSSKTCREWQIQTNEVKCSRFSSGRMFLPTESDQCKLEIEIVKNNSGTRFYLNLLFLQVKPCENDPSRTEVQVFFDGEEEPWMIYPLVFEGGQRLLLPDDIADYLIQKLQNDCSFRIKVGRFEASIIPEGFQKAYLSLKKINIT